MDYDCILTREEIARLIGFMGCEHREAAARLGVSVSHLSRVINGKMPVSEDLNAKMLALFREYLETHPEDRMVGLIWTYCINRNKTQFLSLTSLRQIFSTFTPEDFKTLSQRARTYRHELKRINMANQENRVKTEQNKAD